MKKTFKLVLAAMLALLVFVSCENKTDVSNKTALDYLGRRNINILRRVLLKTAARILQTFNNFVYRHS